MSGKPMVRLYRAAVAEGLSRGVALLDGLEETLGDHHHHLHPPGPPA